MKSKNISIANASLCVLILSSTCQATTGYFALGYGPKSVGMAGATVAAPQDAMAAATNPAGMGLIGERVDLSLRIFSPIREAALDPRVAGGSFEVRDKSSRNYFFIPGGGFSRRINDQFSWGVTLYANGGMNTRYRRNIYDETAAVLGAAAFGGRAAAATVPEGTKTGTPDTAQLGVDLGQAIIAPTLAYQLHPNHTLGLSVLLSTQYFKAYGLGNFQCFTNTGATQNPAACSPGGFGPLTPGFVPSENLTNKGYDWAFGIGARLGWIGQIHPMITLGLSGATRIYMTKFDKYKELFAEQGSFDIPANIAAGIAFRPIDNFLISFDYQRIFYSDVKAVGNPGPVPSRFGPSIPQGAGLLGSDNGLGFGWADINVYRIGLQFQVNQHWTVRAGYSYNDSPIPPNQLLFNIISLAVNQHHATTGFTYSPNDNIEWNFAYMHAFNETINTATTAFGVPGSIKMRQNSLEFGFSWKF